MRSPTMRFFTTSLSFVLFAGFLLVSTGYATSPSKVFKIPLERVESGLERLFRQGAELSLVEGLYDMNMRKAQGSRWLMENAQLIPTQDTLNLFKYFQTQYVGSISIGSPGNTFKMVLDTTWAYTWVPSKDCPIYYMACALHKKYDHSKSSTYVKDGRAFDISKELSGYMSKDVFHLKDGSIVANITNQGFAEMTKIPFIFSAYPTDGTIGLGLKALSPMALPFFDNLAEQYSMEKIFSCYIDRHSNKTGESVFYLGGVDYSRNTSEFTSVDLTSPYFWQFNMTKVSVVDAKQRKDFCAKGCSALADTSSDTIVGPVDEVKAVNNLIGATKILFSNRYWISCKNLDSGINVTFTISNKEFHIEPKDYIQKVTYLGVPMCISAFQPADTVDFPSNTWALGGAFLYRFYTAFDVDKHRFMIADIY